MKLSDLDYSLPKEKIALFPTEDRPAAKLLCVDRASGVCSHKIFRDLPELLKPTDLLVLNNTKVLPARLFGKRATGGKVEILLLKDLGGHIWEALLKPGGRIKDGERIVFLEPPRNIRSQHPMSTPDVAEGGLVGTVMASAEPNSGKRRLHFLGEDIAEKIHRLGHVPLPPYINRPDQPADREDYQTVFAKEEGAVASPTAGLHFDKPLLEKLVRMGVEIAHVTLHVSYGTFQPITVEHIEEHPMFEEEYEITEETAQKINAAKRAGRRVIVCGTTCVRALESAAGKLTQDNLVGAPTRCTYEVNSGSRRTSIFIYPPYEFKIVDGLITNFHMPKSTLLAMVSAFLGYEKLMAAYNIALNSDYRFASYGDAMFIC
ncbi:MAG: tRNA preQ1(34) S-adenosylmethionine ribosyltransferase-isomerase QueA [Omnitrophica bacterium RIFOXYB12_FULL_50_7]|nr:MAG: tRNA preQ1(34) S-adenosylmethionine ribosyltransferase-isomerase QueA [Omnitrophica bacterium RIFOXYB12_FULL_50_7]